MLSAAKHLQYLLENKQMQILRFAQDDSIDEFFRSRFSPADTAVPTVCSSRALQSLRPQAAQGPGHGNNQKEHVTAGLKPRSSKPVVRNPGLGPRTSDPGSRTCFHAAGKNR